MEECRKVQSCDLEQCFGGKYSRTSAKEWEEVVWVAVKIISSIASTCCHTMYQEATATPILNRKSVPNEASGQVDMSYLTPQDHAMFD